MRRRIFRTCGQGLEASRVLGRLDSEGVVKRSRPGRSGRALGVRASWRALTTPRTTTTRSGNTHDGAMRRLMFAVQAADHRKSISHCVSIGFDVSALCAPAEFSRRACVVHVDLETRGGKPAEGTGSFRPGGCEQRNAAWWGGGKKALRSCHGHKIVAEEWNEAQHEIVHALT